jgi:hypothetical protein
MVFYMDCSDKFSRSRHVSLTRPKTESCSVGQRYITASVCEQTIQSQEETAPTDTDTILPFTYPNALSTNKVHHLQPLPHSFVWKNAPLLPTWQAPHQDDENQSNPTAISQSNPSKTISRLSGRMSLEGVWRFLWGVACLLLGLSEPVVPLGALKSQPPIGI